MKKFLVAILVLLIFPYGCKVLKRKTIDKSIEQSKISNDVKVSTLKVDSSKASVSISKSKVNDYLEEEITVKSNKLENIVLSANFKLDTSALMQDTIKLIDMRNNGITLSIFQKGKEVMATVTTPTSSQTAPFSEINIKRKSGKSAETSDSLATFQNHSEIKKDSVDKSKKNHYKKDVSQVKEKESTPNFWIWIGLGLSALIVIYFIVKK